MKKNKKCGLQQLVAFHIIELRKKNNILQKNLAAQIGISQKSLSLIENGCIDISLSMLEKMSVILKVPVAYFLSSQQTNDVAENVFIDRLKLLSTIDEKKLKYVLALMDIFIDNTWRTFY